MKVWVMRHGEAQGRARTDAERELTAHGRDEVLQSATHLIDKPAPLIIASPYVRTRQTAQLVREALGLSGEIVIAPWLTPESDPDQVLRTLDGHLAEHVLLVSHQPLVGALIGLAVHGHRQQPQPMSTASLAELEGELPLAGGMQLLSIRHV